MPKASVNAIITILRNAQQLGVDIHELKKNVGLSADALNDPDHRIESRIGFQLMTESEAMLSDPLFGLKLGNNFQPADMGLVGFLVLNAPTLHHALKSYCQFQTIYGEGMRINTETTGDSIYITFLPHPVLQKICGIGAFQSHMAGLISTVNWLLNKKLAPEFATFKHKKPTSKQALVDYRETFGNAVQFSEKNYCIVYHNAQMNQNVVTNNPDIFRLFEHRATRVIEQLGDKEEFKTKVAACLLKSLDGEKPSLEKIADQLHKSPRTIQRLLKQEATSFQQILDEVRRKSASYYLTTTSMNMDEIAYLLGYGDSSAFRKSFKKWLNCTPEAYRKQQVQDQTLTQS